MDLSAYERAFQRIVDELRPYLDRIVIIGGWVSYLRVTELKRGARRE